MEFVPLRGLLNIFDPTSIFFFVYYVADMTELRYFATQIIEKKTGGAIGFRLLHQN